jgi:hypothetical protein
LYENTVLDMRNHNVDIIDVEKFTVFDSVSSELYFDIFPIKVSSDSANPDLYKSDTIKASSATLSGGIFIKPTTGEYDEYTYELVHSSANPIYGSWTSSAIVTPLIELQNLR